MDLPEYARLPVKPGAPPGSAWDVWGDADQVGTINLLTPDRIVAAAQLIRRGAVFNLDLPLHLPDPPLVAVRKPYRHTIYDLRNGNARDDYLDSFYLQASSQWDALRHMRHPEHGFYNGVDPADIHSGPGARLGIEHWAERGIVGRAVLCDVGRYVEARQGQVIGGDRFEISPDLLDATLADQGVALQTGDIFLLRTGALAHWLQADATQRAALYENLRQPGLEPSDRMLAWIWDHHLAAIAADCVAVEAWPPDPDNFFHFKVIPLLDVALGEIWNLEGLAHDCSADGVYEAFFASKPLKLRGGGVSPPNAMAIK
ncbi:MAG TPA: cyclase family protein [Dehalococcoidia bacterium]|nr:cyclase family protein [Dehalococcoidia bacterium]